MVYKESTATTTTTTTIVILSAGTSPAWGCIAATFWRQLLLGFLRRTMSFIGTVAITLEDSPCRASTVGQRHIYMGDSFAAAPSGTPCKPSSETDDGVQHSGVAAPQPPPGLYNTEMWLPYSHHQACTTRRCGCPTATTRPVQHRHVAAPHPPPGLYSTEMWLLHGHHQACTTQRCDCSTATTRPVQHRCGCPTATTRPVQHRGVAAPQPPPGLYNTGVWLPHSHHQACTTQGCGCPTATTRPVQHRGVAAPQLPPGPCFVSSSPPNNWLTYC
ncbi:uncharacterized protein LOC127003344 isoform X3 [Eriocheir sinensis]|uniref:uncharacterized protein LOC127003344 isoform X3 n=1 Tax=Eriocheir sinensis TaxID=95602 RepID=UPI0021CAB657|nr:uncharacterized protein LOC127003344 isoform X3 [Eriocheir sinensis]